MFSTLLICRKQLKDFFSSTVLHGSIMQILDQFISTGRHNMVDYLMPGDAKFYEQTSPSDGDGSTPADVTKFDQLMTETHAVLSRYQNCNDNYQLPTAEGPKFWVYIMYTSSVACHNYLLYLPNIFLKGSVSCLKI